MSGTSLSEGIRNRAQAFLQDVVRPLAQDANPTNMLLWAIFLSVQKLIEVVGQGGSYYRITPFRVVGGGEAVRIVDIETNGIVREVDIWLDSAVGAPDPTIRLSTGASGSTGGGVRMQPGVANTLGKVPPNTTLYISSTDTYSGYVVERG